MGAVKGALHSTSCSTTRNKNNAAFAAQIDGNSGEHKAESTCAVMKIKCNSKQLSQFFDLGLISVPNKGRLLC